MSDKPRCLRQSSILESFHQQGGDTYRSHLCETKTETDGHLLVGEVSDDAQGPCQELESNPSPAKPIPSLQTAELQVKPANSRNDQDPLNFRKSPVFDSLIMKTGNASEKSAESNDGNVPQTCVGRSDSDVEMTDPHYFGSLLNTLVNPGNSLPKLKPSGTHKLFIDYQHFLSSKIPVPYPNTPSDQWSDSFVRMPCSPENLYPVVENRTKSLKVRWSLIEENLRKRITTALELQEAILSYNSRFNSIWNFGILHYLVERDLIPDGGNSNFFGVDLPALCALALNLPIFLTQPIPLMKSGRDWSFTFSQLQISSLLANAFFCTFPRRNSHGSNAEFANYPLINFSSLFSAGQQSGARAIKCKSQKLRCLLHYFHRVTQNPPTGTVTYTRRHLGDHAPVWSESERSFSELEVHINSKNTIEDAGKNTIQVDFANSFLGGGVLNTGCVQEEIMFVLRPELIAACLFTERLGKDETLIIEGAERYSSSSGYAETFQWTGDFNEADAHNERDEWGRWKTTVVAMDARHFHSNNAQFYPDCLLRELNKAYCGFTDELAPGRKLPSVVATGNWGCGAFRGNVYLKALLQMMACVQAGKSLAYFTFGDETLCRRLYDMYTFLSSGGVKVGELWKVLVTYEQSNHEQPEDLYDFLKRKLSSAY